jgi:hypothetical protein
LLLYFLVDKYSLLYYWDAVSHLIAGRKLVDWSENPGLNQIGTVWMPLPHLILLPFSLIDPLFTTGFAGLAVSLPCTAMTSVLLYRIVKAQTGNKMLIVPAYIGIVAGLLYATNPNILYLGLTSMTEAPFMFFFVASAYYLQKWYQTNGETLKHLIMCCVFVSLASSYRYEAWLLPIFVIGISIVFLIRKRRRMRNNIIISSNTFGFYNHRNLNRDNKNPLSLDSSQTQKQKIFLTISISIISLSGVVFWLVWNQYHYNNPFEFASERYYSASWYAQNRPFRELLFLQPINVLVTYSNSILAMYGPFLAGAAIIGFFFRDGYDDAKSRILYLFLLLPPLFTIISVIVGIGELSYWFNSRFLVLLSPLIISLSSNVIKRVLQPVFDNKKKSRRTLIMGGGLLGSLFVYQIVVLPFFPGIITIDDAAGGYNVKDNQLAIKTGEILKSIYDGKGQIMVLTGSGLEQRIMITSGLPLRNFDEIIEGSTWKASFKEPWAYDRWMIISKYPASDAESTTKYWLDRMNIINQHYITVYENEVFKILEIRK